MFEILICIEYIGKKAILLQFHAALFNQIYLQFYNRRTLGSRMFDDFPLVSNYGKLPAQFHVGGLRYIEMVRFMSIFKFPARTIIEICFSYLKG